MSALSHSRTQLAVDLRTVAHDPLLRWLVPLPLLVGLVLRLGLPLLLDRLGAQIGRDLSGLVDPLARQVALMIAPALSGMAFGFLLLDMRDDRTLMAIRTTPISLAEFLAFRLTAAAMLGLLATVAAALLVGYTPSPSALLAAALAATPIAPVIALSLACLAENKVQGLALTKGLGAFLVAPLGALAVPPAWQPLFLLLPTAWPGQVASAFEHGDPWAWGWLTAALAFQGLLIVLLLRRLEAR